MVSVLVTVFLPCNFVCFCGALRGKSDSYCHDSFRSYEQWLWDHVTKFAGWQHPALGRGARFVVSVITSKSLGNSGLC